MPELLRGPVGYPGIGLTRQTLCKDGELAGVFFIFRTGIVGRKLVNEMSDVRFQQLDMLFFHQFGSSKTWCDHLSTFFGVHLGGIFTVCFFGMGRLNHPA